MARSLSFGHVLKRSRRAAGLTQEELAERAGYSVGHISKLEQGARTPSAATVQLLADALALTPADRASLEVARRAVQASAHRSGSVSTARRDTAALRPLVGRSPELALLERHITGLEVPVLLFTGEPGLGKTRLLQEARRRAQELAMTVLEGSCYRGAGQQPFAPLLTALERCIGLEPTQRVPGRRPEQTETVRIALRGCEWLVPLLPELGELGIEPLPKGLPAGQERRLMFRAVVRFLSNVAGPGGTLLVLDDLHWAGADAVELLATVARSAPEANLRIVGAYRDTELSAQHPLSVAVADLAREDLVREVRLGPLARDEAADLLNSLLGHDIPHRERVLQRAAGIPLFLVGFAAAIQAGTAAGTPPNLVQGIQQQVTALPPLAQEVLQIAAVAGRRVLRRILYTVSRRPEREILPALDALLAARLLIEDGDDGYRFSHDLIRDVVEENLGAARCSALHGRIGVALEQLFPGVRGARTGEREPAPQVVAAGRRDGEPLVSTPAAPVELLAYHFARSDDAETANVYLERAAENAQARFALSAAEDYFRTLIGNLDRLGHGLEPARRRRRSAAAREKLGSLLMVTLRYDEALDVLGEAAQIDAALGDLENQMRVTAQLGLVHARRRTPDDGIALLRPMLALAESGPLLPRTAALYVALADLFFVANKYGEGLVAAERAAELARQAGDQPALAGAEIRRATALITLGHHDDGLRALEAASLQVETVGDPTSLFNAFRSAGFMATSKDYLDRALEIAKTLGDPAQLAFVLALWRQQAFMAGDWERARELAQQAVDLVRQVGEVAMAGQSLVGLGVLRIFARETEAGLRDLDEAVAILEREHNLYALVIACWILAERDLAEGDPGAARTRIEQTFERYGIDASTVAFPPVLVSLALAYLELGDEAKAQDLAEGAHARATAVDDRPALCDVLWLRGVLCGRRSQQKEADRMLLEALSLARAMPFPYGEARAHYWYGMMHLRRGERRQARQHLQDALAIFRRLGDRLHARAVEIRLQNLVSGD